MWDYFGTGDGLNFDCSVDQWVKQDKTTNKNNQTGIILQTKTMIFSQLIILANKKQKPHYRTQN